MPEDLLGHEVPRGEVAELLSRCIRGQGQLEELAATATSPKERARLTSKANGLSYVTEAAAVMLRDHREDVPARTLDDTYDRLCLTALTASDLEKVGVLLGLDYWRSVPSLYGRLREVQGTRA